jgi:hypothetical protein
LRLPIVVPNPAHSQFIARESSDPREETLSLPAARARQLLNLPSGDSVLAYRDRAIVKLYFNSPIFTVQGYQIDVFSNGGSLMPASTGSSNLVPNPASLTGVVNSSQGARNLQFGLKYSF